MGSSSQKSWLTAAKRTLSKHHSGLTWDGFAKLAGIDPRAFKTYRMPEDSSDYRTMPSLARSAVENLLRKAAGEIEEDLERPESHPLPALQSVLIPSLAALVVRQAQQSLIEGRMIAGVDRNHGCPVGLSQEDRMAMALVSRACLVNGLPDCAAEIHDLLFFCSQPLQSWLDLPEVVDSGLGSVCLINADEGVPTPEAEELASGFNGLTTSLEEQLFAKFMEIIGRYPGTSGDEYYAVAREFVVRHPICTSDHLRSLTDVLPSPLWIVIQQQFYEPVPESWQIGSGVPICDHCGNAMRQGKAGLVCRTHACNASLASSSSVSIPAMSLMRASRGIRQYWIEPGLDEIRLHDTLRNMGYKPVLYPSRDRVDIAVDDIGIDLKAYASPETLGWKFRRSQGGLVYYKHRWVVVPDWLVEITPSYIQRLRTAADRPGLSFLTVSDAVEKMKKAAGNA